MFNKKAIVSLNLFVLLIVLFLVILSFSYFYLDFIESKNSKKISTEEVTITALSLRSFFTDIIVFTNQTSTYHNPYESSQMAVELNSSTITVTKQTSQVTTEEEFSLYGIEFCSNYTITPVRKNTFSYNGTCIQTNN